MPTNIDKIRETCLKLQLFKIGKQNNHKSGKSKEVKMLYSLKYFISIEYSLIKNQL